MPEACLTTHVLDTARGLPARGLTIRLYRIDGEARVQLFRDVTNGDGRTDTPLLTGDRFRVGTYEILFEVGPYLDAWARDAKPARFLDDVPVRFTISDMSRHYHVPLLLSPFGYTTYRGS